MDPILQVMNRIWGSGITFIMAFQALGSWLTLPMNFFTFLGSEEFFLSVLPALYWSINAGLGARLGVILLFNGGLNEILKLAFHTPRPYWIDQQVRRLGAVEPSFGAPSGHSQASVVIWGTLAAYLKRPWAWAVAIILILMVGLSRIYLGVHFPHDVLLGWLIGACVLWAFLHWHNRLVTWIKTKNLGMQIGLAFVLSILMLAASYVALLSVRGETVMVQLSDDIVRFEPPNLDNAITNAGALFGFLAGLAWITSKGGFSTDGQRKQRLARYILGLVGVLILWYGLGVIFPRDVTFIASLLRYIRYTLVGGWIAAGAPYLFLRLHLAEKANLPEYATDMQ